MIISSCAKVCKVPCVSSSVFLFLIVDENSNNLMVDTTAAVSDQHDAVSIATAATAAADSVDSHELKDPDPVVLHVLPSAVSAEC